MRFSDHRRLVPEQITVNERGLLAVLSRSKTLGSDKAIGIPSNRGPFRSLHQGEGLVERRLGSPLQRQRTSSVIISYLSPTSTLKRCKQAELLYSTGFALLNKLLCSLHFPSTQLLVPQLAQFWTPHSRRSFLPSCTSILGFDKSQRDFLGGWSAQGSDRYARVAKLRVENMWKAVTKAIHSRGSRDPRQRRHSILTTT